MLTTLAAREVSQRGGGARRGSGAPELMSPKGEIQAERAERRSERPPFGGKVLRQVVVQDDRDQREDHEETDLEDALLDGQREVAPGRALDGQQEEVASVQD